MNRILLLTLLINLNFIEAAEIKAYAIGIFDKKGNGENIQHTRKSKNDYNGICYSKVILFSKYQKVNVEVEIGNSKGHFEKSISIFNKNKIKIAEELTFKHYSLKNGYFKVKVNGVLKDSKVYIK
ncbi:hypothetical protein ACH5BF_05050 [Arcobacter sp. YIC-464]|uniref:hypothetical protein n=1 Tax=Arcobacter sp. YIC-464 TaxID=3376631 RepID=UPI003C1DF087